MSVVVVRRTLALLKHPQAVHGAALHDWNPFGISDFCRNGSTGSNNGNLNGDGPLYIAPAVAYSGNGNDNGRATCLAASLHFDVAMNRQSYVSASQEMIDWSP